MDGITVTALGTWGHFEQHIVEDADTGEGLGIVRHFTRGGERPYGALGLVQVGGDREYYGWHATFENAVAAVVLGIEVEFVDFE